MQRFRLRYALGLSAVLAAAAPALAADEAKAAPALDPRVRETVAALQGMYDSLEAFKVVFKQTDELATLGKSKTAEGTFYFRKPGRMRWDYERPDKERKLIVVDDRYVWVYLSEDRQVYRSPVGDALESQTLIGFLGGLGKLDESFDVRLRAAPVEGAEGGRWHLHLAPKGQSDAPEFDLFVRAKSHEIARIRFDDPFGNVTTIDFGPVQSQAAIPPELFVFEVPEGVTVQDAGAGY